MIKENKPEYNSWLGMCQRAGIRRGYKHAKVCRRWRRFELFVADMGKKPTPHHTLDRIDNAKGYTLDNCRWATKSEQQRNKTNNKLTAKLVKQALWTVEMGYSIRFTARAYGVAYSTLKQIKDGRYWRGVYGVGLL